MRRRRNVTNDAVKLINSAGDEEERLGGAFFEKLHVLILSGLLGIFHHPRINSEMTDTRDKLLQSQLNVTIAFDYSFLSEMNPNMTYLSWKNNPSYDLVCTFVTTHINDKRFLAPICSISKKYK